MVQRLPKGCVEDKDRHGNIRIYFRKKGYKKIRLKGIPFTPDFMVQYEEAQKTVFPRQGILSRPLLQNTWSWLCLRYFNESADFKRLDSRTGIVRRRILEGTFTEKITPESNKFFADIPLANFNADAIEVLRDRKLQFPESANGRVKAIRQVLKWALKKKLVSVNAARDVELFKSGSQGYHTWTLEEVAQYEEHYPIGSKARLAFALLLYTGQRRSDIIRFGRQHAKHGTLTFTQHKGRNLKPHKLTLPILPVLQKIIDASPVGDLTFLVNEYNRPFSDTGFGNKFRKWCVEAGLPNCTPHGLRKAGATIAVDNGATAHQLMAMFGWSSIRMAEHYTRKANQVRLAKDAMHLLEKR
jgi:integrase